MAATLAHLSAQESSSAREPLLITVDELAELLSVSTRTVWRRLSSGEIIEPIRIGSSVRWRLAEVKTCIEHGCVAPNSNANYNRR